MTLKHIFIALVIFISLVLISFVSIKILSNKQNDPKKIIKSDKNDINTNLNNQDNWQTFSEVIVSFNYPKFLNVSKTIGSNSYQFSSSDNIYNLIIVFGENKLTDNKTRLFENVNELVPNNQRDNLIPIASENTTGVIVPVYIKDNDEKRAITLAYLLSKNNNYYLTLTLEIYSQDADKINKGKELLDKLVHTVQFPQLSSSRTYEKASSKTVDFASCSIVDNYQQKFDRGSTYLFIKSNHPSSCVAEIANQINGEYTIHECQVPKSQGVVTFNLNPSGSDFSPIMENCLMIKSGSISNTAK